MQRIVRGARTERGGLVCRENVGGDMKIYTTSREDYLKAIYVLQRRNNEVRSVDVARYLGFSKPSVCHAVSLLTSEGFLQVDDAYGLHLTESGLEIARKTYERHCFFSNYLIELGVDRNTAMEDACRMEHAISDESFEKLKEALGPKDGPVGRDYFPDEVIPK